METIDVDDEDDDDDDNNDDNDDYENDESNSDKESVNNVEPSPDEPIPSGLDCDLDGLPWVNDTVSTKAYQYVPTTITSYNNIEATESTPQIWIQSRNERIQ